MTHRPSVMSYPSAHEAYAAWKMDQAQMDHSQIKTAPVSTISLEARDCFRKLREHFGLFGFLTDATFEGFCNAVLHPSVIHTGSSLASDRPD